jgi:chromate transporter
MPRPIGEIFGAFLRLGLSSFGGPIAHLEYFRREFVDRRRWLDAERFGQLLAIAQFLPGPASSQLGFGIGLLRGGWRGALAAFVAFTLPSAVLLFTLAILGTSLGGPWWLSIVHGLKLVAVVVVADGVWRTGRQLTSDLPRLAIAGLAAAVVLGLGTAGAQLIAIAAGAVAGTLVLRPPPVGGGVDHRVPYGPRAAVLLLSMFALGLALALLPRAGASLTAVAAAFWRAGALVFGGGHVVLPLLETSTVTSGWIAQDAFLAGYGAAQAIPGPMFAFAAYLGALAPTGETPALGALVATLAVFTPGFLLMAAILPLWARLAAHPTALRGISGINAAVVGLLAAALWDPVIASGIADARDVAIAAAGVVLQRRLRRPTPWVLMCCVLGAMLL